MSDQQVAVEHLEIVKKLRMLTPDERLSARNAAREHLERQLAPALPSEPKVEDFIIHRVQKYPKAATYMQWVILFVILLFGFIPSAMRVYSYGSTLFSHVINNPWASGAAGVSLVIMAEASVIGFSLARLFTSDADNKNWFNARRMFAVGVALATLVALVFNVEATVIRSADSVSPSSAFVVMGLTWAGWIESLFPPLFVLFGAHGLVEIFLRQMEDSHAQNSSFEQAHYEWRQTCQQIRENWQDFMNHIEDAPEFERTYRNQLWRFLMEANRNIGYATLSKLPDRLRAVQIAKELRAETGLDDEINKLLTVRAEKLAQNNDAIAELPPNFLTGS